MTNEEFLELMGELDPGMVAEAEDPRPKKKPRWVTWATAACLCLAAAVTLLAADAYAASSNAALLDTAPPAPEGLTMTVTGDPTRLGGEIAINNDTDFVVIYGVASRLEQLNGEEWVELEMDSQGLFSRLEHYIDPHSQMFRVYARSGIYDDNKGLDEGTYRYQMVVSFRAEVEEEEGKLRETLAVLSSQFEVEKGVEELAGKKKYELTQVLPEFCSVLYPVDQQIELTALQ